MATEQGDALHFEWTQGGDAGVIRTIDDIKRRLADLEQAHRAAGRGEQDHKRSTDALNTSLANTSSAAGSAQLRLSTFGSTLGLAAQGVATFSAGGGRLVSILGQATGAITGMSAAMGPWGIALGVATAAFSLLSNATDSQTTSIRRQTSVIRDQAIPALDDYISSIRRGLSEQERLTRVRGAQGSVLEQRAEVERLRGLREQSMGSGAAAIAGTELLDAQIAAAEERLQQARARMAATPGGNREETAAEAADRLRRDARRGRRGGGRSAAQREEEEFGSMIGRLAGGSSQIGAQMEAEDEGWLAESDAREGAATRRLRAAYALREKMERKQREMEAQAHRERMEEIEELQASWGEVGRTALEGVMALASGDQKALAAWLKSFGIKMAFRSAEELATAIGLTIEAPPLAAEHYAAAAKFGLIAAAAGGAGIALGGGGGGGGAGRATPRARPEGRAPLAGNGEGGKTIIVNLNDPAILVGTEAEVGRRLQASIRAAEQRFGG